MLQLFTKNKRKKASQSKDMNKSLYFYYTANTPFGGLGDEWGANFKIGLRYSLVNNCWQLCTKNQTKRTSQSRENQRTDGRTEGRTDKGEIIGPHRW